MEGAPSQDAGAAGRTQGAVLADEGSQGGDEDAGDAGLRSAAAVYGLLSSLLRHTQRDMSLTSLATLATLSRTGPRRITDLAAVEGVTQPSVTTLVTNLERAGLVERRSDTADKRVVRVAITDKGADYLAVRRQASIEAFASLIGDLSPAQAAALAAAIPALERLRELDDEKRDPTQPTP